MQPLIIFGSARRHGNTRKVIDLVCKQTDHVLADLNSYSISNFDYNQNYPTDDFPYLIQLIHKHQKIILATPVYWNSMSAQMKTFTDRFGDLLISKRNRPHSIKQKQFFTINSYGSNPSQELADVFVKFFDYLRLNYAASLSHYSGDDLTKSIDNQTKISRFKNQLFGKLSDFQPHPSFKIPLPKEEGLYP